MHDLKVGVLKVMGHCDADLPMKPGDYFTVHHGAIRVPEGGTICLWALQSLMPLLPALERPIVEAGDWMARVRHVQCPDPKGRVVFRILRSGERAELPPFVPSAPAEARPGALLQDLRVTVDAVRGTCTSGMEPGDCFYLRSGRITIPADRHFCLYALQAVLPLLPAKQRPLPEGDWLREDSHVICPDPAGNVVLRITVMAPAVASGAPE